MDTKLGSGSCKKIDSGRKEEKLTGSEIKKILGRNIRKYRVFKEWEQKDLALKVDLQPETISRLENGKENVGLDNLTKICDALGVGIEELFIEDSNLMTVKLVISEHNMKALKELIVILVDLFGSNRQK